MIGDTMIRFYVKIAALVVICATAVVAIIFAPLGMTAALGKDKNWTLLGNAGQAYGGISALISALALAGVAGALLVQARQHRLDMITAIRERQSGICAIVREDPQLYWPVLGGDFQAESIIQRRMLRIEYLQYLTAAFETGLIPEESLRSEPLPIFFHYEENRKFWEMTRSDWLVGSSGRMRRKFVRIADDELAHAKSAGPGLSLSDLQIKVQKLTANQEISWQSSAFVATAVAVGLAFLFSRCRRLPVR